MVKVKDPCQDTAKTQIMDFVDYVAYVIPGENGKSDKICKVHDATKQGEVVSARKLDQFLKKSGVPEGLGKNLQITQSRYSGRSIWQNHTFGPFIAKDHYGDKTVDTASVQTAKGEKKVAVKKVEKFVKLLLDEPKLSLRQGSSVKGSPIDNVKLKWDFKASQGLHALGQYYYQVEFLAAPKIVYVSNGGDVRKASVKELKRSLWKQGIVIGKDIVAMNQAAKRLNLQTMVNCIPADEIKNAKLALQAFSNAKKYVKEGDLAALAVCVSRLQKNPVVDAGYLKKLKFALIKDINQQKYKSSDILAKLANKAPGLTVEQLEFQMQATLKILTVTNKRDSTTEGQLNDIYSKRLLQEGNTLTRVLKSNNDPKYEMQIEGRFAKLWSKVQKAKANKSLGSDDYLSVVQLSDQIMKGDFRKA